MSTTHRHRLNVIGSFYVEDGCCIVCGVPQFFAPALFGESEPEHGHCYVRRQPETEAETDAMLRVIVSQEAGCIRYAGSDPVILRRLVEVGEADQCDEPVPRDVVPIWRDHVRFTVKPRLEPWTARAILERLLAFKGNSRWKSTPVHENAPASASVSISWFEDRYHRIEAFASKDSGVWILRQHGPRGLSDSIHDWLDQDQAVDSIRWQTSEQSDTGGAWTRTPW